MNIHVLKRLQHYPSRPVSFYMYTLSQFPLWIIQSQCCRLYGGGYYHQHYKPTYCQVPNLITWVEWNAWSEAETFYNSVLRKLIKLPAFCYQQDSNPQPQDYQTDALVHIATHGCSYPTGKLEDPERRVAEEASCTPTLKSLPPGSIFPPYRQYASTLPLSIMSFTQLPHTRAPPQPTHIILPILYPLWPDYKLYTHYTIIP